MRKLVVSFIAFLLLGLSSLAMAATVKFARKPEMKGKQIVTIIPSFAERYLSTLLFEGL